MSTDTNPPDDNIPLVMIPGILRRMGAKPPGIASIRNAGYDGRFVIEKVGNRLFVPRSELPTIAALYRPAGSTVQGAVAA